ncbi:recombinase family protein [Actinoplanes sp. NPDC000266]
MAQHEQRTLMRGLETAPAEKLGIGYIRVSDVGDRGDELISPELQEYAITTWADANGVRIVKWIKELNKSGRNFTRRKVSEIVKEVAEGEYTYVVLWKWSRWGRNMKESQIYLGKTEEAGGVVRAATEDFDPDTTMGRFTRDQMLLIAQLQSDMISDGWKEAQDRRRRNGLPHTGARRFGYLNDKISFWPDPDYGPVLASLYERYVAGVSARKLALELNTAGVTTVRGNAWDDTAVTKMLDTGFGAGLIREHSKPVSWDHPKRDTKRSITSYDVWRQGDHQPVIPLTLWDKYKKKRMILAAMPPRARVAVHALSGAMKCGWPECGGSMVVQWGPPLKRSAGRALNWGCNTARKKRTHAPNYISDPLAQSAILAWLTANAQKTVDVTEEARRLELARRIEGEVEAAKAEVRRLKAKRSRLSDGYTDGDIEREDYRRQKAEIALDLDRAEGALSDAEERQQLNGPDQTRAFGVLADEWHRLDNAAKRDALLSVVHHFVVMPKAPAYVRMQPDRVVPVERWRKLDEDQGHGSVVGPAAR